ncbi:hypothetical protein BRADI_2g20773v3 [Brachypodium distachyon]|uniref:Uncharacterized protein n=1 Tax=Brachypodium distachyon TaxID=15368 RepID=A0A0Q3G2J8_BRADI|nr:hypothetical protein BRADI_2g20773v3 [Brachypodium distachyon]
MLKLVAASMIYQHDVPTSNQHLLLSPEFKLGRVSRCLFDARIFLEGRCQEFRCRLHRQAASSSWFCLL